MQVRRSPAQPPGVDALEDSSPELLTPADPWAGDERITEPAADPRPEPWTPALADWDAAFLHQYGAILDGRSPWGATAEAASALQIDDPRTHDRRPPKAAPFAVEDVDLAHMVEDRFPDVRPTMERVLGPFADQALPPRIRCAAAVVLGKPPLLRHAVRVFERTLKDRPKPEPGLRAAIRAVLAAPAQALALDGDRLRPLLPMAPRFVPDQGLSLAGLEGARAVLALPIPLEGGGWWLAGAVPLSEVPDAGVLTRRLDLELQRLRRHDRRLTWEDLLRDRPEVLYRTACEWIWMHDGPDSTSRLWQR